MALKESRNPAISILKALGIMLMVLGHTGFSSVGTGIIYTFHMPLFFIAAGYCFKNDYIGNTHKFLLSKVKGLYLKYVIWSLLFLLLHNTFYRIHFYNESYGFKGNGVGLYNVSDYVIRIKGILISMTGHDTLVGTFWFLKSLFWGSVISYFIIKCIRKPSLCCLTVFVSCVAFIHWGVNVPIIKVGRTEILASLFFLIGYWFKNTNVDCIMENKKITFFLCIISFCLVILGKSFWSIEFPALSRNCWLIPYVCSAVSGTLIVYFISLWLSRLNFNAKTFLIYLGDNSFSILLWHFTAFKLVTYLIVIRNDLPIQRLAEFPIIDSYSKEGWWILYFVIGVFVPITLKYIGDKVFSKLFH